MVTPMPDSVDVLVIGAGQAGLAAHYWLGQRGVDHLIVDRGTGFGESWRSRWDSLMMITPNWMNGLPDLPYPGSANDFSPRATTIDYLRRYGEFTGAPVRWGTAVRILRTDADGILAETSGGQIRARHAIVATGPYQAPAAPIAPGLAHVFQVHSSRYRAPGQLPAGDVLVVGSGNSGVAIAVELAARHDVVLACGSNPRVPRRVTGTQLIRTMGAIAAQELKIPEGAADREADLMRWLDDVGFYEMTAGTPLGRRLSAATSDAYCGPPLHEVARAHGIRLTGRVTPSADGRLAADDGTALAPHSIVWATGYRHDFGWIHAPVLDAAGAPRHVRGVTDVPGLYFLGLRFLHTASSSLLYGVGRDARHIVEQIVDRCASSPGT
jgi:putative flavoprotein involved in K+ transport